MRRISNFQIVAFNNNNFPRDYIRMCSELVGDGFQPYGKPYYNGEWMFREFVKYEYVEPEDGFAFEEDEVSSDPWENHDFFEEIETDE